jgi:hypothetical protein
MATLFSLNPKEAMRWHEARTMRVYIRPLERPPDPGDGIGQRSLKG